MIDSTEQDQDSAINLREILEKYLFHWKWFAMGSIVCLVVAFIYLRYTVSIYESHASVLIKEDDKAGSLGKDMEMLKNICL